MSDHSLKRSTAAPGPGLAELPGRPPCQARLELAKWIALAAMAVDHYGKIVEPSLYLETHAVGRVAFPLLAMIVGLRLAARPELAMRYLRRLLPWALLSQPVFVLAGRPWHDGNILFTLLLGVLATMLLRRFAATGSLLPLVVVAMLVPLAWFVEFSVLGVAMVPATALLAARGWLPGLLASGPLGVLANIVPAWPPLGWVDCFALFASGIALASVRFPAAVPRLPTHAFYAFYPAHILTLHFIDLYR